MKEMTNSAYNNYFSTGLADFGSKLSTSATSVYANQLIENAKGLVIEKKEIGKYDPMEIVAWFLAKEPMTHLKLQKMCYYAQAWFYTLKKVKLMNTDFEAWIHGPVAPDIYDKLKCFGFEGIRLAEKYNSTIEDSDFELLESVWETYGDRTGNALAALTHTEKPWINARAGYAPNERCNVVITLDSMSEYYSSIYIGGDA